MAVAFDAASEAASGSPSSSVSWSHTCGGSATALVVGCGSPTITGATYNSVSMTALAGSGDNRWRTFYLGGPTTGTNTVTVNFSNTDNKWAGGVSMTGSDTTSDLVGDTDFYQASAGTSTSRVLTTTRANSLNVDALFFNGTDPGTVSATGTNQTERVSDTPFADGKCYMSTQTTTSVTDYTMSWSWTNSTAPFHALGEIRVQATVDPNVFDSVTVSESITVELNSDINVNDTVTVTESVSIDVINTINVYDEVTVTESITVENTELGPLSVSDDVTVAEAITAENAELGPIDVGDSVTVTESVSAEFITDISVFDSVSTAESVSLAMDLGDISVNDAVTITESVSADTSDPTRGFIKMRSNQQSYPIPMDDSRVL